MTQQSQIHATIAGHLYTFTLTASTDTPAGEVIRAEVISVAHDATGALRVGLTTRLNAVELLVQGPVEVAPVKLRMTNARAEGLETAANHRPAIKSHNVLELLDDRRALLAALGHTEVRNA